MDNQSAVMSFMLTLFTLLTPQFYICSGSSDILCTTEEREALLTFKQHLEDPSDRLASWAGDGDCCEWEGVVCNNVTGHVLELYLASLPPPLDIFGHEVRDEAYQRSRFGGKIHHSLLQLKHLSHLNLSWNDFEGMQIPTFLGSMSSLTYLDLSASGFRGMIPHQIGNLSNLQYLDLHGHGLSFLYAEKLQWLSSLSSLQCLDLSFVDLSKAYDWLHILQTLPSLVRLNLSGCPLQHHIHPSGVNFSSLVILDLSHTSFIPKWIFGLGKLVSLQLRGNNFPGPIPDGIQNLTLLENLDLSFNFLNSIPNSLYNLSHLKRLLLHSNNLCGTISASIGNLTSLILLDLAYNNLEGKVPISLGNLCNLRELSVSNLKCNQEVSEILDILSPCVSRTLETLFFVDSNLSGHLPDQIGKFKNLLRLRLYNNSIQGPLPSSLVNLSSLKMLDICLNHLNGNPFEIVGKLSQLQSLYIAYNLFQGVVNEASLANLASLQYFLASGNLTLEVSPRWKPRFQLQVLEMISWNLGPKFPSWIQTQKHLAYLDLSCTNISDSIPIWFEGLYSRLLYVNLSHNQIYGELSSMPSKAVVVDLRSNFLSGHLPCLTPDVLVVALQKNKFSGSVVEFLCHEQKSNILEYLNLASNNLSGKIPDCWMKWRNLLVISLYNNHFTGNIPSSFGSLSFLEMLYLRNNKLSGTIPLSLKNCSQMISLDLSKNQLFGIIPGWIGVYFPNLRILLLRSNQFFGKIPQQICNMSFLQILDLAQNNLTGNIPNCLNQLNAMISKARNSSLLIQNTGDWSGRFSQVLGIVWIKGREYEYATTLGLVTSIDLSNNNLYGAIPGEITSLKELRWLNLSHNHLRGQIPDSIGNMRFTESIDLSMNQLSGEIPSSISNLSFLSSLNLSYNYLMGQIPMATQLQTFEASCFVGNDLCGPPLPNNCSSQGVIPSTDRNHQSDEVDWFYVSMSLGFVVGFWGIVGPLLYIGAWRLAYFGFIDRMWRNVRNF